MIVECASVPRPAADPTGRYASVADIEPLARTRDLDVIAADRRQ
jgi:hypothetical protein